MRCGRIRASEGRHSATGPSPRTGRQTRTGFWPTSAPLHSGRQFLLRHRITNISNIWRVNASPALLDTSLCFVCVSQLRPCNARSAGCCPLQYLWAWLTVMKHGGTLSTIRRSPLVEGYGRLFPIMQDIVLYHAILVSTLNTFGYKTSFLSCLDSYFSRWGRT